jgi:pimeloyl-ACP methyl ester carboxylesterase
VLDQSLPEAWAQAVRDAGTAFGVELAALQGWPREATDLENIRTPTLSVVHPDANWPGFGQIQDGLLGRVPGCTGTTVDVPSHLLQIAEPTAVAEAVAPFLGVQ